MTTHFAHLPTGNDPYLLHCWLRTIPAQDHVWVLAAADSWGALTTSHPNGRAFEAPGPDGALPEPFREALAQSSDPTLNLPLSPELIPMRYHREALMSDLAPHYGLLRDAWRWGFRAVNFTTHQRSERLELPHLLDAFHNRHRGQRCFVVGNGPSLKDLDMTRLKNEITLGSNRCFLGYESWGFPFTYWGVYDKFQIEAYHPVYESEVPVETPKFFPLEYASVLKVAHGCPINSVWPRESARAFSGEPGAIYVGFTVTYMLLQIAACMGCDPIILIGTDHRYELTRRGYSPGLRKIRRGLTRRLRGGRLYESARAVHRAWKKGSGGVGAGPALWTTEDAARATHFTEAYTDGGRNQFLPPEPEEAERDFDCAHAWAERNGRQILNATPGSALNSFPRIEYDDLF